MTPLPPRMILLSVLALFILPLAAAWMMFTGSIPFSSKNTLNLGQLVVPTVALDWSGVVTASDGSAQHSLEGFWVVLHELPRSCAEDCLALVTGLRQVQLASGHNFNRIKIALLIESDLAESDKAELLGIYAHFNLISHPSGSFSGALRKAGSNSSGTNANPSVYLVDPLGNIMMTYNGDDSPNKLNKDLIRLLTWSKLDKRS